jgi:hypothetical protein
MVYLTADDSWQVKDLGRFVEPVEISDANGKLLGLFVPAKLERGKQIYAKVMAETDWAEIDRRAQSTEKGHTTREVFEHLKSLTQDPQMQAYLQKKIDGLMERDRCATP